MAEILFRAVDNHNPNWEKDLMCYKTGMPVIVKPDGGPWGKKQRMPNFFLVKIPGVSTSKVAKYREEQMDDFDPTKRYRRRLWKLRLNDLPQHAKNLITGTGYIIIKAGSFDGDYDYTWPQIKNYFRNLRTGQDEVEDL